jgi:diguanylate cyclase (GGDEF)-like protein/PAS domain S-box-containing protein
MNEGDVAIWRLLAESVPWLSLALQVAALALLVRLAIASGHRLAFGLAVGGLLLLAVVQHVPLSGFLAYTGFSQVVMMQAGMLATSLLLLIVLAGVTRLMGALRHDLQDMHDSEERYRLMVDAAGEGIWLLDESARTLYVNHRMARMLGYAPVEMLGKPLFHFMDGEARSEAEGTFKRQRLGTEEHGEFRFRRRDGEPLWTIVASRQLAREGGGSLGTLWIVTDITERLEKEKRSRHLTQRDPLTGLPDRSLLIDRIAQDLKRGRRYRHGVAVLFVDLDRFKPVNDFYGHAVGDVVLREVADRLKSRMRRMDTVARFGGDEFVVVLPDLVRAEEAASVAAALVERIGEPFSVGDGTCRVGASIGIAFFPDDGREVAELLGKADAAMYAAKKAGGGQYRFYSMLE